jgi:hypothetical protein
LELCEVLAGGEATEEGRHVALEQEAVVEGLAALGLEVSGHG